VGRFQVERSIPVSGHTDSDGAFGSTQVPPILAISAASATPDEEVEKIMAGYSRGEVTHQLEDRDAPTPPQQDRAEAHRTETPRR